MSICSSTNHPLQTYGLTIRVPCGCSQIIPVFCIHCPSWNRPYLWDVEGDHYSSQCHFIDQLAQVPFTVIHVHGFLIGQEERWGQHYNLYLIQSEHILNSLRKKKKTMFCEWRPRQLNDHMLSNAAKHGTRKTSTITGSGERLFLPQTSHKCGTCTLIQAGPLKLCKTSHTWNPTLNSNKLCGRFQPCVSPSMWKENLYGSVFYKQPAVHMQGSN